MTPEEIKARSITVDGNGNLQIVGKWQIGELLTLGRMFTDTANSQVIEFNGKSVEQSKPSA